MFLKKNREHTLKVCGFRFMDLFNLLFREEPPVKEILIELTESLEFDTLFSEETQLQNLNKYVEKKFSFLATIVREEKEFIEQGLDRSILFGLAIKSKRKRKLISDHVCKKLKKNEATWKDMTTTPFLEVEILKIKGIGRKALNELKDDMYILGIR